MDDAGFTACWVRDRDRLRRALALSLGDAPLASEAVDEAFTRAYARWDRVSQLDDPTAWLYRVAANWATSWLRKRRLRPVRPAESLDRPTEDRPDDGWVLDALAALPATQRSVVVLRFYLDWDIARIASALEVAPGTVKSRLHRALARLRTEQEVHP
ncbi:MAG: sigma-70 family RNA polymerase sigma factor [Nitriliruptoraceae bacterium]|nr:sigma-70 family RNA polymerase sigma factor [Nitriliruptoraceae bacterium]